jgi:hypothetical protein
MHQQIQAEGIIYSGDRYNIKFLLLKKPIRQGGFWQPLVAKLEDHQHAKETILEELKETTGIQSPIKISNELWKFNWQNSEDVYHESVYGIQIDPQKEIELDTEEYMDYKWVTYEQAMILVGRENNRRAFELFRTFFAEAVAA